ncbi:MAG: SMI1/KNR4 family protein [Chitinophagaceae bacterium]
MPANIKEKLSKLPPEVFAQNEGATEEMIRKIEAGLGLQLPEDYRQLMLLSDGGTIQGPKSTFNYEPAEYLVGHNKSEFFNTYIPGTVVIGDDGGGCIYYYDPRNHLGKGNWALFYVSMGTLLFKESVHLSSSLDGMIDRLLNGEHFGDMLFQHKSDE